MRQINLLFWNLLTWRVWFYCWLTYFGSNVNALLLLFQWMEDFAFHLTGAEAFIRILQLFWIWKNHFKGKHVISVYRMHIYSQLRLIKLPLVFPSGWIPPAVPRLCLKSLQGAASRVVASQIGLCLIIKSDFFFSYRLCPFEVLDWIQLGVCVCFFF